MESENTKRGENWNDVEVEEMLNCIKNKYISNLVNSKNRHNRKVYDKIALHMKKKGFNRKGFQVRIKFKNLKSSYYKVKNCNDKTNLQKHVCEYFTLLDEILNSRPEDNSVAAENDVADRQQTEEDTTDETEDAERKKKTNSIDPLKFLASQSLKEEPVNSQGLSDLFDNAESESSENSENSENNKRRENWTDLEVEELLHCIKNNYISNLLYSKNRHNRKVFDKIALHMKKKGFNRNWYQIRIKFKSLKADYYKVKNCNDKSIAQKHACEYFTLLDQILGSRLDTKSGTSASSTFDRQQTEGDSTDEAEVPEIKKRKESIDPLKYLAAECSKEKKVNTQNLPDLIENVDSESSENNKRIEKWKDSEVEEMLYFIQKNYISDLVNSKMKRNQKVFDKIAIHLKKKGYNRNGLQVRIKFNVLKADYYKVKNFNDKSIGQRQTCEFFTLLDEMFGGQPNVNSNETDEPKRKNKKKLTDLPKSSSIQMLKEQPDNDQKLADLWISKLKQMPPSQKLYAEKFISDILFEGVLGNLNRNSIQINSANTSPKHFQKQSEPVMEYGTSIKQERVNGTPDVPYTTHSY